MNQTVAQTTSSAMAVSSQRGHIAGSAKIIASSSGVPKAANVMVKARRIRETVAMSAV
jgi:hypothetical protein